MKDKILKMLEDNPRGLTLFSISSVLSEYDTGSIIDCLRNMREESLIKMFEVPVKHRGVIPGTITQLFKLKEK